MKHSSRQVTGEIIGLKNDDRKHGITIKKVNSAQNVGEIDDEKNSLEQQIEAHEKPLNVTDKGANDDDSIRL